MEQKGKWFEESKNKGLLYYLHGYHNVVIGLERALGGKKIGDRVEITLKPVATHMGNVIRPQFCVFH